METGYAGCWKFGCAVFRVRAIEDEARDVRRVSKMEASVMKNEAETKRTKDCTNPSQFSGDNGERDPPVPIPNTEVKPFSADGTWLETTWESRTLPDSMKKGLTPYGVGSFFIPSATFLLSGRLR